MDYYRHRSPHPPPHPHPHPAPEPKIQPYAGYGAVQTEAIPSDDVVFYVGKHRHSYHVNAESLMRGSAYFRNLLEHAKTAAGGHNPVAWPPLVIDCEEAVFENVLLLMRYGTFEALPPMPAAEAYQVKKEANFYGITYVEPCAPRQSRTPNSSSDVSCTSSPRSAESGGSPKSTMNISPPPTPRAGARRTSGRHYEGVHLACGTPQKGLAELPEFPLDLADPGRLVLLSCLDAERAKIYKCNCGGSGGVTQWALNFHHRHAFCTACGEMPRMSAKHFADMFMAAAAHYATEQINGARAAQLKWQVGCDSTCHLRFVSSPGDGADACRCAAGSARAEKSAALPTIWAASSYYSHAFCTGCSEAAERPVLLSLLLALRYGGGNKGSKSSRFTATPPSHSHYLGQ